MCGRYRLKAPPSEVGKQFDLDLRDNFPPRYNIAPTQPIALVRQGETSRKREFALARWGFIPGWAKGDHLKRLATKPLINARAETAMEKPTFRSAFRRRRCLIPADGFYEWRAERDGKQPFAIQQSDGAIFAFGGLWETAHDPDGGEIDTAAILTVASGPDLRALHAREPVVIRREDFSLWLEADEREADALNTFMRPGKEGSWTCHPVSSDVGNVRNDGPGLIEPIRTSLFD